MSGPHDLQPPVTKIHCVIEINGQDPGISDAVVDMAAMLVDYFANYKLTVNVFTYSLEPWLSASRPDPQ